MENLRTWRDESLAWVELHRPVKLNALNERTLHELLDVLSDLAGDPEARVLVLTGAGERAFAAGADIAEMNAQDVAGIRRMMELGKRVAELLEEAPQPVIAAVNGFALGGGCELALACDLICAADSAQFGLPEVNLGILPGWGGSQRIERRAGYGLARDMLFTGRRVPAAEAHARGLCDRLFPLEQLRAGTRDLAASIAAKDPVAVATAKRALRLRSMLPLAEGLGQETALFTELFDRPERVEAMGRFLSRS